MSETNRPTTPGQSPQEQFLTVRSRDEALAIFRAAVPHAALGQEAVTPDAAHGRVLARDITAPIDVPSFDRSTMDGFAVRAADVANAREHAPVRLVLNAERLACGVAPAQAVTSGTATQIATGGMIPRGADAVVMVEQTDPDGDGILIRRAAAPGQAIAFAGSDMALGETVLRVGTRITAREIAMLAACGLATVPVLRRPRVAVLSTGNELVPVGEPLPPGMIYDANGAVIAAAVTENGGEPVRLGIVPDEEPAMRAALLGAIAQCDLVILSGGTSKGEGDVSHRVLADLPGPGILVHGVALKPGKPLCLAKSGETPIVILPGFPTSAMFTFHDFVAPLIRAMAGWPAREQADRPARIPVRMPSDPGRTEFVMVALSTGADGLVAYPLSKGSGAVTAFAQADGYVTVEATSDAIQAGEIRNVTLFSADAPLPDLTLMGSHCLGLDIVAGALERQGIRVRIVAVGSSGGLGALKRGECDLAALHLLHPESGTYNAAFLDQGHTLLPGWRRRQGIVFRKGDARFEGRSTQEAVAAALADADCLMVSRNAGAGTRMLIDGLLKGARPPGYWNQPRSHNAVAASVAQGRADWGVAIATAAHAYGLGFLPLTDEHYDFAGATDRLDMPTIAAFRQALASDPVRAALREAGFAPSGPEAGA